MNFILAQFTLQLLCHVSTSFLVMVMAHSTEKSVLFTIRVYFTLKIVQVNLPKNSGKFTCTVHVFWPSCTLPATYTIYCHKIKLQADVKTYTLYMYMLFKVLFVESIFGYGCSSFLCSAKNYTFNLGMKYCTKNTFLFLYFGYFLYKSILFVPRRVYYCVLI